MNLFRRRKPSTEEPPDDRFVAEAPSSGQAAAPGEAAEEAPPSGPYDESHLDDGRPRVDLGALRVPPRPGMELRLEVEDATKRVVAATIGLNGSTVQLQAFAAPRSEGIWDDIRAEIAAQVTKQGGSADEVPGSFGRELLARLPARTPDGRTTHRPVRFAGVDGPRWFLRAVFSGPAASDEDAARELEDVVRGVVVVRGADAMVPREVLPLKLPPQGPAPAGEPSATGDPSGAGAGDDVTTPPS